MADELTHLKERSLLALRGLSDLSTAAYLHELATRLLLGVGATGATAIGLADTQLLLGGLIGVWTAAAFAARLRHHTAALIAESAALPVRWDAALVHRPALDPDDAAAAVAWLYALDELEGPDAAAMLRSLADAESCAVRLATAVALAEFPARSNAALAALHALSLDDDVAVRDAAAEALEAFQAEGVLVAAPGRTGVPGEDGMAVVLDRLFEDGGVRGAPAPADGASQWIFDAIASRVEYMGSVALTQPDALAICAVPHADADVEAREVAPVKVQVPLFDGLRWSEVHGLATLALFPAGYELMSVVDGGNLPLRFVGLGWLLAVGGLAAYPQSGSLWRRFKKTLDDSSVGS